MDTLGQPSSPPPLDGSLTLPEVYDWHRERFPNHRLFIYIRNNGTIRNITYSEAVAAIHASGTTAFFTTQHGLMRANYVLFPISPRNSAIAVAHLVAQAKVGHVLVCAEDPTRELLDIALNILKERISAFFRQHLPVPQVQAVDYKTHDRTISRALLWGKRSLRHGAWRPRAAVISQHG
ncbi:hypothetical protein Moror_1627, partial [Moniliophthora roreri MCA 2997]